MKLFVNCAGDQTGKYELRPAVKKLFQLRPKMSASRVSVASRVVNPKHDELRPAVNKELYQWHRNIGVYKMSSNWKVLTQFYCTLLCTQLQGGSNMTRTDLCVNKPHCAAAVRP